MELFSRDLSFTKSNISQEILDIISSLSHAISLPRPNLLAPIRSNTWMLTLPDEFNIPAWQISRTTRPTADSDENGVITWSNFWFEIF